MNDTEIEMDEPELRDTAGYCRLCGQPLDPFADIQLRD